MVNGALERKHNDVNRDQDVHLLLLELDARHIIEPLEDTSPNHDAILVPKCIEKSLHLSESIAFFRRRRIAPIGGTIVVVAAGQPLRLDGELCKEPHVDAPDATLRQNGVKLAAVDKDRG